MNKYIILGNGTGWCFNCWAPAVDGDRIRIINDIMPSSYSGFLKKICFNHNRFRLPAIGLRAAPMLKIWYRNIEDVLSIDDNTNTVIILYDWNFLTKDFSFLKYIRGRHKKVKFIYLFSNIIKVTGAKYYGILDQLKNNYDLVFAFDRADANKYGFEFSYLIYTSNYTRQSTGYNSDLFYIGRAKDRYETLISIFEKAQEEGLKCDFNIVGVPVSEQKYKNIINYSPLPYDEVKERIQSTRCLVDAIQSESSAMTIKVCESVVFNKKLITTNYNITKEPFFDKSRVYVYPNELSLKDFVFSDSLPYSDDDKFLFSPERLFFEIENKLR